MPNAQGGWVLQVIPLFELPAGDGQHAVHWHVSRKGRDLQLEKVKFSLVNFPMSDIVLM